MSEGQKIRPPAAGPLSESRLSVATRERHSAAWLIGDAIWPPWSDVWPWPPETADNGDLAGESCTRDHPERCDQLGRANIGLRSG
jgi:hypothetical protein